MGERIQEFDVYIPDEDGIMQKVEQGDITIGVDYAGDDKRDATVLTLGHIVHGSIEGRFTSEIPHVESLDRHDNMEFNFKPLYVLPIHPFMLHHIKYSSLFGTTNSKRKFRHRNYEKALRRSY